MQIFVDTPVASLEVGDLVDLEGDSFADPAHAHSEFEFELQTVESVLRETVDCVAVGFEGFDAVGFPPSHHVLVAREVSE